MSRLDRKQGRFSPVFESYEIDAALGDHQSVYGQEIDYFRFSHELTQSHDIYDEGAGAGRVYFAPVKIPVLQVIREEGPATQEQGGLYWTDTIRVIAAFRQLINAGLTELDIQHGRYLKDRFVYDQRLFRVTAIRIMGQVRYRDVIVSIEGVQLKREDILNDPQFSAWWSGDAAYQPTQGEPYVPAPNYGGSAPHTHPEYAESGHSHDGVYAPAAHAHTADEVGAYTTEEIDSAIASALAETKAYTLATAAPKIHTHEEYLTTDDVHIAVNEALQPVTITFPIPSTAWEATYNFPRLPDVTTTTAEGQTIQGNVVYLPPNKIRVEWAVPVAGVMYLR